MNAPALIPSETLPTLIDRATSALESARNSAEVLEARDMARVAYDAAKSAGRMGRAKKAHDDIIAAVYCAQADALMIEARAKIRLADEYGAAQDRGEVAKGSTGRGDKIVDDHNDFKPATAADLGLRRDEIHEARKLRDAERAQPGLIQRSLDAMVRPVPTPDNPTPRPVEPTRAEMQRSVLAAVAEARKQPDRKNHERVADPFRDKVLTFIDHCEQLALTADLERIAAYSDPLFPTTRQRLDRNADAAFRMLEKFMELRNA